MSLGTLLIVSLGELGTSVLEAAGRSGLFARIVVASRSAEKARGRINNALLGCGIEGSFPRFDAIRFDLNDPSSSKMLRDLNPDVIFTAPTLKPWWKVGGTEAGGAQAAKVPFGGYLSLQLAPMAAFREVIADSGIAATWIAASYPDVVNPILVRSGYGPSFGIGNVQEPIPKLQALVGRELGVSPTEVSVKLVAQHAFEYFVFRENPPESLPPYRLKISVGGQDHTALGERMLRAQFTFPYDLHFNRITASAALAAMRAVAYPEPVPLHLPGILGLVGGYPVVMDRGHVRLNVHPEWSENEAIATNEASLPFDGIGSVEADGTAVFSTQTITALRDLTGKHLDHVTVRGAADQAEIILRALG